MSTIIKKTNKKNKKNKNNNNNPYTTQIHNHRLASAIKEAESSALLICQVTPKKGSCAQSMNIKPGIIYDGEDALVRVAAIHTIE